MFDTPDTRTDNLGLTLAIAALFLCVLGAVYVFFGPEGIKAQEAEVSEVAAETAEVTAPSARFEIIKSFKMLDGPNQHAKGHIIRDREHNNSCFLWVPAVSGSAGGAITKVHCND